MGRIRRKAEANGAKFVAVGKCTAGGHGGAEHKELLRDAECDEGPCWALSNVFAEAKIVLAFERHDLEVGMEYLSEKPFVPLAYNAIPAYFGKGQRLMDQVGLNRGKILDYYHHD